MTVFTDGLFVVREGQHRLTQAAALQERLLVNLLLDVANQDLRGITHIHRGRGRGEGKRNAEFIFTQIVSRGQRM